ncbi:MAG: 6,7-dimethyl-8-ribityllumazine synthase [bacterium]
MREYQGSLIASGKRFGIIVSRFNDFLTKELLEGALDCLTRHGAELKDIEIAWVPGGFELPLAVKLMTKKKLDAIIALAVLIRGETPHFDFIASQTTRTLAALSIESEIPVAFGVITADTTEQAMERAGIKEGNKGFKAALSAIEMANLKEQFGKA